MYYKILLGVGVYQIDYYKNSHIIIKILVLTIIKILDRNLGCDEENLSHSKCTTPHFNYILVFHTK